MRRFPACECNSRTVSDLEEGSHVAKMLQSEIFGNLGLHIQDGRVRVQLFSLLFSNEGRLAKTKVSQARVAQVQEGPCVAHDSERSAKRTLKSFDFQDPLMRSKRKSRQKKAVGADISKTRGLLCGFDLHVNLYKCVQGTRS